MTEVTSENWSQEVYSAGIPVLVEVYSPTCVPCKMLKKVLETMESPELKICTLLGTDIKAQELGVMSVPSMYYYNGEDLNVLPRKFKANEILEELKKY